jgi:uncharacterized membrane protein
LSLLTTLAEHAITLIHAIALGVVVLGTLEAVVRGIRVMRAPTTGDERGEVWLRYARWLVAALTFQLGADIVETSISTTWEILGKVAAIAVIRTFLTLSLEHDAAEVRARQTERS